MGPTHQKSIDKLEAIQRHAAQFVLNRYQNTSSVHRMLDSFGWPSLEQRRKISCLGVMYKIYNGLVHCPIIKTKRVPLPPCQRCTHCQQLSLITTRTQYRGGSFLPRTIRDWNSLSKDAVEATTVTLLCHVPPTNQSTSLLLFLVVVVFYLKKELETVQQFKDL